MPELKYDDFYLLSHTSPAIVADAGKNLFKKEIIRPGTYTKHSNGQAFQVKDSTVRHWVETFKEYKAAGNLCPIPVLHDLSGDPTLNKGWVEDLYEENGSLYATMMLQDPALADVSDVSLYSPSEYVDAKNNIFKYPILHISLTTTPLIPGLRPFEKIAASLDYDYKESDMPKDWTKISEGLGIKGLTDTNADELILAAFAAKVAVPEVKASVAEPPKVDSRLIEATAKLRSTELDKLVANSNITTAVRNKLAEKFCGTEGLSLSLSTGVSDSFEDLVNILASNSPVELKQKTHVQVAVLPDVHNDVSPIVADAEKRAAKSK